KTCFRGGKTFHAFFEKDCLDLVELVAHGQTLRMAAPSFVASNGLVIQPVAPVLRARAFLSSENSVDRTRIGVPRNSGTARTASISSKPSILGMLMSVIKRSGFTSCMRSSP